MLRFTLGCCLLLVAVPLHAQELANQRDIREKGEEYGSIAFSPDSKRLYSAGSGDVIKVCDVATGELLREIDEQERCYTWALTVSPDGKTLAAAHGYSGNEVGLVRLFDVATGDLDKVLRGHKRVVRSIAFSADGNTVTTCGDDHTLRWWDAATGEETAAHPTAGVSFDYDTQSGLLAIPAGKSGVELWDARNKKQKMVIGTTSNVYTVAISPAGRQVATSGPSWKDSSVQIWDVDTGELVTTFGAGHEDRVSRLAFSPDGRFLASAALNGGVTLWDPATGKQLSSKRGGITSGIGFSPDCKWLAQVYGISDSGSGVMLWEVAEQ
jgi:tricorn protease-like protein